MGAPERAPLGAALALLIAVVSLTAGLSPWLMAALVGMMSLMIAIAWPDLLELASPMGSRIVIAGTGLLGAVSAVVVAERWSPTAGIVMVCAIGVIAAFFQQMLRRERHELTASLTGTVAGVVITGLSSTWVLAQQAALESGQAGLVTAIAGGLATALLLNTLPVPTAVGFPLAAVGGTGVTIALGTVLTGIDLLVLAAAGAITMIASVCTHLLLGSALVSKDPAASLAVGAGPCATAGVVAFLAAILPI
jgi:hypothetical protein